MPNANDLRKTLTDPTPLYFAAGVLDKLREEAPQALAAVRETDPKEVQARVAQQAKETQAKVSETLGGIDTDIKKLREQAQHLALQSLGVAAEYAVKAREHYDELAVRGREAVKNWRGESAEESEAAGLTEMTVRRESVKVAEPPVDTATGTTAAGTAASGGTSAGSGSGSGSREATASPGTKSASKSTATGTSGTSASSGSASSGSKSSGSTSSGTGAGSATGAKKSGTTRKTAAPRKPSSSPKSES